MQDDSCPKAAGLAVKTLTIPAPDPRLSNDEAEKAVLACFKDGKAGIDDVCLWSGVGPGRAKQIIDVLLHRGRLQRDVFSEFIVEVSPALLQKAEDCVLAQCQSGRADVAEVIKHMTRQTELSVDIVASAIRSLVSKGKIRRERFYLYLPDFLTDIERYVVKSIEANHASIAEIVDQRFNEQWDISSAIEHLIRHDVIRREGEVLALTGKPAAKNQF